MLAPPWSCFNRCTQESKLFLLLIRKYNTVSTIFCYSTLFDIWFTLFFWKWLTLLLNRLLANKIATPWRKVNAYTQKEKKYIEHKQYAMKTKWLNFWALWGLRGCEISRNGFLPWHLKRPIPGMESNWTGMTETGNSFHAASSLCHTSSTVSISNPWPGVINGWQIWRPCRPE